MTIEEVFNIWQNKSIENIDMRANESIQALYKQLEETKKELWDSHYEALKSRNSSEEKQQTLDDDEIKMVTSIHVTILVGPHTNSTFVLRPTTRSPSFIGRSTGKKFVQKGISLSKDNQVSTTHGKFSISKGVAYFTDTGSTNGTILKGNTEELEVDEKLELQDGMVLVVGLSELIITLGYD